MARLRKITVLGLAAGVLAAAAIHPAWPGRAQDHPAFGIPIDCAIGETCFVQNYVDVDPGPGAQDFMCGTLTYDGHKGVDFRIPDLQHMADGVPVLAAAGGVVLRTRDTMRDVFPNQIDEAAIDGTECGNGLVMDHGDGWETQYCHLRRGSVAVVPGQRVAAGDMLGLVGLSGKTEFPHLHISFRHDGRVVDPYLGPEPPDACGGPAQPLWSIAAQSALGYRPSGMLNVGFTAAAPTLRGIEIGEPGKHPPAVRTNLILYVRFFGLQAGDQQRIQVFDPSGAVVVETTTPPAEKNQAQWMQFAGRRAPPDGWAPGTYRGEFALIRDGAVVLTAAPEIDIR